MTSLEGNDASEQIRAALRAHLPAAQGLGVLAISGGRDSMTMLHAASRLRGEIAPFCVVTVDHALRPDSAADAEFVRAFAVDAGLCCVVERVEVASQVAQVGGSIEAAARQARYQALARVARQVGAAWAATAHHADDQAETVLLHLLRGTSLHGLGGMRLRAPHPTQPDLTLIRPLLELPRELVTAYADQQGVTFREDSSNADLTLRRNHLRHQVMPLLRQHNPRVSHALGRLARHAQENADLVERMFEQEVAPHIRAGSAHWQMPLAALRGLPAALQKMFVVRAWRALAHSSDALELAQVERALTLLLRGDVRLAMALPRRVPVSLRYEGELQAVIGTARWQLRLHEQQRGGVPVTLGEWAVLDGGRVLLTRGEEGIALRVPPQATYTLRGRRAGDRLRPSGLRGHSTSLAEWMVDRRIPREERNLVPLLCVNDEIAVVLLPSQSIVTFAFTHGDPNSVLVGLLVTMW